MAVQAYSYLVITDGSTTVTIGDGANGATNYHLTDPGWAPAVAAVRSSTLGAVTPYSDVTEELVINIEDTTAALAYGRLATLAGLLDQADRWSKGEPVSAVEIKYAPQGSTIASSSQPYRAVILGRADGDETSGVKLPVDYDNTGWMFQINAIAVKFRRRGLWGSQTESASVSTVANPGVMSITMPSAPSVPHGSTLTISGFSTAAVTGAIDIPPAYLMLAPLIDLQQAETTYSTTLAASATYTSTADATARASGGNVGRLAHASAAVGAESVLTFVPSLGTPDNLRQVAVYCTYRNNTASAWTIRASGGKGLLGAASVAQSYAPAVRITAAATNPTVLYVGTVASRYGIDYISLNIACTTIAGACTLDLDTIVFVDRSTNEAYVVTIGGAVATLGGTAANQSVDIAITNSTPLLTPTVSMSLAGGQIIPQSYSGPAALASKAGTLKVVWYGPHLYAGTTPYWATQNVGGSATLSLNAAVSRRPGYLVPV